MKKFLSGFIVSLLLAVLISADTIYQPTKRTAEVESYQNVLVFSDSKPVLEYEYLGSISYSLGFSGQYEPVRDALIKKAKQKYPNCNAIILHLKDGGTDKADVLIIK